MKVEECRVAVADLTEGMYVCRLDRQWEGTPFPLQGVAIRSQADIDALARHCSWVYVDVLLGVAPAARAVGGAPGRAYAAHEIEALQHSRVYPELASFDAELPQARDAQAQAARLAGRILDDVREGRRISPEDVRGAVEPMVRSMVRNVDAFLWIDRLRTRGAYEYGHALNCSALAAAFGRHVGFPEPLLVDMASGALLLDIGKLQVAPELLARPGPLDAAEMGAVRAHVERALEVLDDSAAVPAHVREMIRTHHERIDGSGYPGGLEGERIPLLGRIAAVIDSYDAMTSDRPHRKAAGQHVALQELYRGRDRLYSAEVVEQFMQCMSVYPVGSLVELSSGEVAIVMAQNAARRLMPRVMLLTAPDKQPLRDFGTLDLMMQGDRDVAVRIAAPLPPGAYGLDPVELFL
ncbi:HD-GYP domain-containing protein [Luteimonas sp. RD2P54]|uniref:HD-GYP domain-containing protein n=1 Tax=Luteimonas endophytica TaxID=3042023 RepID=A0ABT6JCA3_9GAMM|nr:HD-GYP domain-containing protein [Luteimonas endophytica]MDH5824444.1 HD-GYP domain-containing protein [Luteimonas endophytica]